MVSEVGKLVHVIRENTWIASLGAAAEFCTNYTEKGTQKYTKEQIQKFCDNPAEYLKFVKKIEALSNTRFKTVGNLNHIYKG
jgi:hypothetical protein